MRIKIILLFLLVSLSGCLKYETQFEGPYEDGTVNEIDVELPKELVILAEGDVYLANKFVEDFELIEDQGEVKLVSINHSHTKVAFKRSNENIQIFDIAQNMIIDEVPNSDNAFWFDFHANNETIYFYSSWLLETYGPEVLQSNPTDIQALSPVSGNTVYLRGVAVLENGDFIYSISTNGVGDRLYRSDGTTNLESELFSGFRKDLRLNKEEDALWAGSEYNNRLFFHNPITLVEEDKDDTYFIGAPIGLFNGYQISINSKDRIYFPTAVGILWVSSPDNKNISAIDF